MITAIEIENFKGFGERQRIELAPITLLFGANSAGKSSFFHALFYLHEIFTNHNPEAGKLFHFLEGLDLGGFENTVHNHEVSKQMMFRIEFDVRGDDRFDRELNGFELVEGSMVIELSVANNERGQTYVVSTKILIEGDEIFALNANPTESLDQFNVTVRTDVDRFSELFDMQCTLVKDDDERSVTLPGGAIPPVFFFMDWAEKDPICDVITQLCSYAKRCLDDLIYIGPSRSIPSPTFEREFPVRPSRWASGLGAWDYLHQPDALTTGFLDSVNRSLEDLKVGIEIRPHIPPEKSSSIQTQALKSGSQTLRLFRTVDQSSARVPMRLQDVGFGVSQIVPVVVALLFPESKTVVVEQPELHLHPKLQTELGDLLIETCLAEEPETQAIIETHSEHLILRILRRIRETTDKELPEGFTSISPGYVAVNYFQATSDGTKVTELRINNNGEFIDRWPYGFFDERIDELY